MRLTIVGCAGSVAGPDSAASCYLLEAEHDGGTFSMLLDLGSGAIGPLQRYVDPPRLDAVVISHGHPDHCADLAALDVLRRYGPANDDHLPAIPLLGPAGLNVRIGDVSGDPDDRGAGTFSFDALADGDVRRLGPLTVTAARAFHPIPALAFLIEGPAQDGGTVRLLYTGDTDRCAEVDALAARADIVLSEAGWAHREVNPPGVHLSARQVADMVVHAGRPHLIVTHVASWVDASLTMEIVHDRLPDAVLAKPGQVHVL